jgi:NADH-quinone oxidoreductase subunit M
MPPHPFRWFALLVVLLLLLSWTVFTPAAAAAPGRAAGRVVLTLPGGGSGPLVLTPGQGGWVGTFSVLNLGAEPLIVSRIAIRGDEDDVRSPSRLSARFVDGASTSATLAPGTTKDIVVSWMPDRDPRVRQAFGHVVVTSTDEDAGEVAMGFRAQVPTGLGWVGEHALALLVGLPLVVLLVVVAARASGRRDDDRVRRTATGVAVVELLLALWTYQRFAPDVGRADGNDGFQLVERWVWVRSIGAEFYVGVDGVSVALVLLAAIASLVATVVVSRPTSRGDAYYAALSLLTTGILGSLVALDMVLLSWRARRSRPKGRSSAYRSSTPSGRCCSSLRRRPLPWSRSTAGCPT